MIHATKAEYIDPCGCDSIVAYAITSSDGYFSGRGGKSQARSWLSSLARFLWLRAGRSRCLEFTREVSSVSA
jgi:hypothetical protein